MTPQEEALWKAIKRLERRMFASSGGFTPSVHASSHGSGGSDPVSVLDLDGFPGGSPLLYLDSSGAFSDPGASAGTIIEPHGITVDGGGSVVTTGVKGRWRCPFDYQIVRWTVLADQAGDVEFDVQVSAFGGSPASIVASAPPELSGVDEDDDTTLSGWTTTGSAGDEFEWSIGGTPSAITRVTLILDMERI